jgi:hypothetical protein
LEKLSGGVEWGKDKDLQHLAMVLDRQIVQSTRNLNTERKVQALPASVKGRVTLRGEPPPEVPIKLMPDLEAAHPHGLTTRHYVVSSEGSLKDVLVFLEGNFASSAEFVGSFRFWKPPQVVI